MTPEQREQLAQLARSGQIEALLAQLGENRADQVDSKGDSLLMLAAYHGHVGMVWALLQRGADPHRRNARGLSPLDGAAFKGDIAVIQALLDAGVDPNDQGPDGRTPLMWAASFDRSEAVQVLLERGASPDASDHMGLTARDHALNMGAQQTSVLFTRLGA